jgi:hypothetical protein
MGRWASLVSSAMIDLAFPVGVTLRSGVSSTKSQYASRQEEIRQKEEGRSA